MNSPYLSFAFARPFVIGAPNLLNRLPDSLKYLDLDKKNDLRDLRIWKIPFPYQDGEGLSLVRHSRFITLLNLGNGIAYGGGMGMPEWVMMDCALLPSMMSGWCVQGQDLPKELREKLDQSLELHFRQRSVLRAYAESKVDLFPSPIEDDEWIGVSEFCALQTLTPCEIMGYSLYSLIKGWGKETKRLGLQLHQSLGAQTQIGVTQWTHPRAIHTHLKMGILEILNPYLLNHSRGGESFLYRLYLNSHPNPPLTQKDTANSAFLKRVSVDDLQGLLELYQSIQKRTHRLFLLPSHPPSSQAFFFYVVPTEYLK